MTRARLWTSAASFCIASIPLLFSACGLGSDMDVGDDRAPQKPGAGGSSGGATSSTGGLLGSGGFTGSGAARNSGGAQITTIEGGAPGPGGARATGGATGTGGAPQGVICNKNTCAAGEYCCNPSCGTCAPNGGACDMKACEDPPVGTPCGPRVCGSGMYCCNESCGICAPLGEMCTLQFCDPPPPCQEDRDCRVEADYCTGCNCRPLATNQAMPPCAGPEVQCLIDPCDGKSAVCRNGTCVVQ